MKTYEKIESKIGDDLVIVSIRSIDENGNVYSIPVDITNTDYQEYLKSLEDESEASE
jgi:hypothetical protein